MRSITLLGVLSVVAGLALSCGGDSNNVDAPAGTIDSPPGTIDSPPGTIDSPAGTIDSATGGTDASIGVQCGAGMCDPTTQECCVEAGGSPTCVDEGTCNGVTLTLNELLFGYAERVPIVPVGGTYHFVYTRSGTPTILDLTVPARVVFTSPTAAATVTRNSNSTINYVADGGSGINASGSGPAGNLNRNVFQPDNGTYTGLDTTSFGAGAGELSLERRFEGAISGTAFHSASRQYDSWSSINVTWN